MTHFVAMELYAERLRLAALADAEARGESFWTSDIPVEAGAKIVFAWSDLPTQMSPRRQKVTMNKRQRIEDC